MGGSRKRLEATPEEGNWKNEVKENLPKEQRSRQRSRSSTLCGQRTDIKLSRQNHHPGTSYPRQPPQWFNNRFVTTMAIVAGLEAVQGQTALVLTAVD